MSRPPSAERAPPVDVPFAARTEHSTGLISLGALVVLAIGFRLTALFLVRYGSASPDWSDFVYYHQVASLSAQGYYPDIQFWVEYPPLFPWLAVGAYQLSLLLPVWIQPDFWFELTLSLVLAVADGAAIVAIDRLGDAFWGKPAGRRSAVVYAAIFLPAFAIVGWFDTLPVALLLVALALIVGAGGSSVRPDTESPRRLGRWLLTGFLVGVGIMLKLFPAIALPAGLIVRPRVRGEQKSATAARQAVRSTATATLAAGLTVVLVAAPFLFLSRDMFLATFRSYLARGSWMSPWAILDGYFDPGGIAALHDRLFFSASALWGQPSRSTGVWLLAAALGAAVYLWRLRVAIRLGTPRAAIAHTGLAIALLLLLSRGFSTQYTLWLLPFVALLLPGLAGALLAAALGFNGVVLEGYLYVNLFPSLHRLLWLTVGIRTILLLWFAVECAVAIDPTSAARWYRLRDRLKRPALAGAAAAAVATLLIIGPSLTAGALARTGDNPAVTLIHESSPGLAIVLTQPDIYDRLYAAFRPHPITLVAEPGLLTWTGDRSLAYRLQTSLAGRSDVALITDPANPNAPVEAAIRTWLAGRYGRESEQPVGGLTVAIYRQSLHPTERAMATHFGSSIDLLGVSPADPTSKASGPLTVTLRWVTRAPLSVDYTESLQLLDGQGKLVTQRDMMPVDNTQPTTLWRAGGEVYDTLVLTPPVPPLPPGDYALIVVLYDHQTLQRLPVQGDGAEGDHARIATVHLTP